MEFATGFSAEVPLFSQHTAEVAKGVSAVREAALRAEGKLTECCGAMSAADCLHRFTLPNIMQTLVDD